MLAVLPKSSITLATALLLGGCAYISNSPVSDSPADGKTLRAGVAPIYPPLIFKRGGTIVGVEADMAKALSEELERPIELVELEPGELVPALLARRIDIIMSAMTITDARVQQVTFAHPYLRSGHMALLRRGDLNKLRGAGALNQTRLKIGVIEGEAGEAAARNRLARAQRVGFQTAEAAIAAVRNGDIDAAVLPATDVWRLTSGADAPELQLTSPHELLSEEYVAWAVRKQDSGLRDLLDTVLQQWNASGKLDQLLRPWLQVRRSAAPAKAR